MFLPAGEKLLARMRAGREAQGDVLCSVALFGAASGLDSALRKDISNMGNNTGSGGCGCGNSSGCSSGCGGGGGCGGGD